MTEEPKIKVGILQGQREINGSFNGPFAVNDDRRCDGSFSGRVKDGRIVLSDSAGNEISRQEKIRCTPLNDTTFTLFDVTIGAGFHWERKQEQTFRGDLTLILDKDETLVVINEILLEDYLSSVISSEMSVEAPLEFLKAHAIMSRSWLMATLNRAREAKHTNKRSPGLELKKDELVRWYDRVDHTLFDVCADDHCQRYQGINRLLSVNPSDAVNATRGIFLVYNNEICDARYHKACGGMTDNFENTWENKTVPYLTSVSDSAVINKPISTEADARQWITSHPDAYCNTTDANILRQILPSFDQETTDFFRWTVIYERAELEKIIREKTGMDFGILRDLIPVERGPSGRIIRLKIEGSDRTITIGKELEIRRWLSRSHLYSSAFVVSVEHDSSRLPLRFILKGAGWGHGVGLCQIGAAVMAAKGFPAKSILQHYFYGAELIKLY
ncbi:MAG TPA: SpoIID/LytB domain-containing protein [Syntrophales bacterium]|nr:SpoIID/LytB domain-containing protein [Syntrophales bacterium]